MPANNLDFLRAIAVLCVFVAHLSTCLRLGDPGSLGRFGVIIFFVHTSLVLMASLERLDHSGFSNWRRLCAAFYIRRAFRIYPLAILAVLLTPVFHIPKWPLDPYRELGIGTLLSNLAIVQNLTLSPDVLGPLWSLPLEVQMYLVLPLAYFAVRDTRYGSLRLWALSVVLALTLPQLSERFGVFHLGPCFVSGVVAYDLGRTSRRSLPSWIFPVAILTIITAFDPLDDVPLLEKLPRAWALSIGLGFVIAGVRDGEPGGWQQLSHWIAKHSYGIYLSHGIVFWVALTVLGFASPWLKALVLIAGSLGVPALLYRYIEAPLIAAGVRIAGRRDSRLEP